MSVEPFERKVAAALAKVEGLWIHHPQDVPGPQKVRAPADFVFGHRNGWGIVEAKHCHLAAMPLRMWEPHQRAAARAVEKAGGASWLLVRFDYPVQGGDRLISWRDLTADQRAGKMLIRADYAHAHAIEHLDVVGRILTGFP